MIKVEQDLLVLDSSFTKDDVLAINEFVGIIKRQERDRIIALLNDKFAKTNLMSEIIAVVKGEAR
jgi:hypothetical protein